MIHYLKGDATRPQISGPKIICHICNDLGRWGAGFVLALSARWTAPEACYREKDEYTLGTVELIPVEDDIMVANMIAQHNVCGYDDADEPPIRYYAVRACLSAVNDAAYICGGTLHMPRIGCGLAGGKWLEIEKIILEVCDVDVYVYDL